MRRASGRGVEWLAAVTVSNTGRADGTEAALVFVRWQSPGNYTTGGGSSFQPYHPPRQALKRFERARIAAGGHHTFTFTLDRSDFLLSDPHGTPTLVPGVWAVAACGSGSGAVNRAGDSAPRAGTVTVGVRTPVAGAGMAAINARRDGTVGAPAWGEWPPEAGAAAAVGPHSSAVAHVHVPADA